MANSRLKALRPPAHPAQQSSHTNAVSETTEVIDTDNEAESQAITSSNCAQPPLSPEHEVALAVETSGTTESNEPSSGTSPGIGDETDDDGKLGIQMYL